ncbi:Xaa-Pro aminopeptidase [Anaerocolumna cellulosilytica]|uniref:Xaa-Pro aminopeptidase n=1 Tax=Anaerocolumna cellulosilytica TaxID=433286 RepID=A0A6S6R956_9FIRM|nr:aminopeptidase P family protein [Anaerocolumna cellulosilytica]MBB5196816.1 Xaa-Pro aminopeptidase [Anaerocolumna cellulosilytica]BCJ95792.1 Xaa-Pro aminopeptidase [Anaerocolumna cellulosilytica]
MIKTRIQHLRALLAENQIDAYIVPTSDFHESEYVGEYFKARKYMSGFTGSAGTLVVTTEEAGLWTDGRYFIQAARQLSDTGITLFKMGEEGVPSIEEFLKDKLPKNGVLGFDGRIINARFGKNLMQKLEAKNISIQYEKDLVDFIWTDRPELSKEPAFLLDIKYSGKASADKLLALRDEMKKKGATVHILTTLDDIAWLFNIRGNDIAYNPVVLSYAVITLDKAYLFVDEDKLSEDIKTQFTTDKIEVKDYLAIYDFVKDISSTEIILLDSKKVNYAIYNNLKSEVKIIDEVNPTVLAKATKNPVEIENLRKAHIKDGVAVTKFMYWLKNNIGKTEITEISASDYLEERRKEQEGFIELSFDTICAYNSNAAMMHYSASPDSHAVLQPEGLLLVDSGGQYYEGTTDITRTVVLGEISNEVKRHFTAVLRSMLNLADARFLHGCIGLNLDILARGPLWEMNLDYKCGTGHGVGYLLNVHEAPNGFRWRKVPERDDGCVLEEGMVTTDEPGVYIEGSHGIRTENELVCHRGEKNEYGQFMYFEHITFAPIDLDAVDTSYMSKTEIKRLNDYHQQVYEKLSPYLTAEECQWLKEYTRAVE